mgnify:CR=1 FL=1
MSQLKQAQPKPKAQYCLLVWATTKGIYTRYGAIPAAATTKRAIAVALLNENGRAGLKSARDRADEILGEFNCAVYASPLAIDLTRLEG